MVLTLLTILIQISMWFQLFIWFLAHCTQAMIECIQFGDSFTVLFLPRVVKRTSPMWQSLSQYPFFHFPSEFHEKGLPWPQVSKLPCHGHHVNIPKYFWSRHAIACLDLGSTFRKLRTQSAHVRHMDNLDRPKQLQCPVLQWHWPLYVSSKYLYLIKYFPASVSLSFRFWEEISRSWMVHVLYSEFFGLILIPVQISPVNLLPSESTRKSTAQKIWFIERRNGSIHDFYYTHW